jgi:hypothetical protein
MSVPGDSPVIPIVKVPVAVSPMLALHVLVTEPAESPQQIPTWVRLAPPFDVTFAPKVALVLAMAVAVGEVTVGTAAAGVTLLLAADAVLVPIAFVAVTVKV